MVLPGAPRTPSNCALGWAQSPMQEMFWLPNWSSWLAPIIACQRPAATMVNTDRYGSQPSTRCSASSR